MNESPKHSKTPKYSPFILEDSTRAQFNSFMTEYNSFKGNGVESNLWGGSGMGDGGEGGGTFFDDLNMLGANGALGAAKNAGDVKTTFLGNGEKEEDDFYMKTGLTGGVAEGGAAYSSMERPKRVPLTPSTDVYCRAGWVAFRSELNFKFLWMHDKDTKFMSATAPYDTGLHHKAFATEPVDPDCKDGGWVKLRTYNHDGYVAMNSPTSNSDNTWVVEVKGKDESVASTNHDYHFLLEKDGYLINRGAMATVNVIGNPDYPVRGHSSDYTFERVPAGRETGAQLAYLFLNDSAVQAAAAHQIEEETEASEEDEHLVKLIQSFPAFTEKRVIAFGLYGRKPKYTLGAIKNVELVDKYFPGWKCRFYTTSDVPNDIQTKLIEMGAELKHIPNGLGYVAGMFWRFMVASDDTVDRYIIRDSDSRLNARDAIAVQEWILSGRKVHIQRDHVNHCIPMNGGMWGGTHDAVPNMKELVEDWPNKDEYGADLNFLETIVYPLVQHRSLMHDSYCCDRFPGSRPYPSKRYPNYQHVGQVFDSQDVARLTDIDGFIRGVPIPSSCRKHAEWIYG